MQFDKTLIAVRERNFLDLLDLALRVVQAHAVPLLVAVTLGSLPFALLNGWLLETWLYDGIDNDLSEDGLFPYFYFLTLLIIWEMPLAAAPTTLYLGIALFQEKPSPRQIARDFLRSIPQLLLCQVLIRGLCVLFVLT